MLSCRDEKFGEQELGGSVRYSQIRFEREIDVDVKVDWGGAKGEDRMDWNGMGIRAGLGSANHSTNPICNTPTHTSNQNQTPPLPPIPSHPPRARLRREKNPIRINPHNLPPIPLLQPKDPRLIPRGAEDPRGGDADVERAEGGDES